MSWHKEKKEHPWASTATAKRIAKDHATKKYARHTKVSAGPIQAAKADNKALYNGFSGVVNRTRKAI